MFEVPLRGVRDRVKNLSFKFRTCDDRFAEKKVAGFRLDGKRGRRSERHSR